MGRFPRIQRAAVEQSEWAVAGLIDGEGERVRALGQSSQADVAEHAGLASGMPDGAAVLRRGIGAEHHRDAIQAKRSVVVGPDSHRASVDRARKEKVLCED